MAEDQQRRASGAATHALTLLVVPAMLLLPASARAEPTAAEQQADLLFTAAKADVARNDYAHACPKFADSDRLDPALGTKYNLADCYEHTGRLASAWSLFLKVASAAREAGKTERERDARARAAALDSGLAHLTIVVRETAPDLRVTRDGVVVAPDELGQAVPVDPGEHVVEASVTGAVPWRATINADKAGAAVEVVIPKLTPEAPAVRPAAEPAPIPTQHAVGDVPKSGGTQRALAIAVASAGVVGVAVGTVFGLSALSKHDQAASGACPTGGACDNPGAVDDWKSARSAGTVSTVSFGLGAAALVGGALLWFTAPAATPKAIAEARVPTRARAFVSPDVGNAGAGVVVHGAW